MKGLMKWRSVRTSTLTLTFVTCGGGGGGGGGFPPPEDPPPHAVKNSMSKNADTPKIEALTEREFMGKDHNLKRFSRE